MLTVIMPKAATIFNGTYTISSPRGGHRTFDISTQAKDAKFAAGKRVLSLLVGPNNSQDYKGFGFVTDDGITVYRKYQTPTRNSETEMHGRMIWSLATLGEQSPFYVKGYRLLVEGRCLVCNRKLTTPQSIESGIGPVCAGREG
jgi:hypothetical protein